MLRHFCIWNAVSRAEQSNVLVKANDPIFVHGRVFLKGPRGGFEVQKKINEAESLIS